MLEFRLSDKHHGVCVTLGISKDPAVRRPTVWWDGRVVGGWAQRPGGEIRFRLFEDAGADAVAAVGAEAVLWVDERKYGCERRYFVPKAAVARDFDEAIDEMVREVCERVDRWYAEARVELDRRAGV